MSLNQVNSLGELERVAGLVNSEKINEMYEAFPSNASTSNKLVTQDSVSNVIQGIIPMSESSSVTGDITFGVDADGNYGYYKVGADTVTPFKSGGVSEFEGLNTETIQTSATDSHSNTRYSNVYYVNTDIIITNTNLTKGIWLAIINNNTANCDIQLKDNNGNYISSYSHKNNINVENDTDSRISLFLFNLNEDKTIIRFRFINNSTRIYTNNSNKLMTINFIKMI